MNDVIPVGTEFQIKAHYNETVEISLGGESATFSWTEVFPEDAIPLTGDEFTVYVTFKEDASMAECRKRKELLRLVARRILRPDQAGEEA